MKNDEPLFESVMCDGLSVPAPLALPEPERIAYAQATVERIRKGIAEAKAKRLSARQRKARVK
jgi:hypothetical protein